MVHGGGQPPRVLGRARAPQVLAEGLRTPDRLPTRPSIDRRGLADVADEVTDGKPRGFSPERIKPWRRFLRSRGSDGEEDHLQGFPNGREGAVASRPIAARTGRESHAEGRKASGLSVCIRCAITDSSEEPDRSAGRREKGRRTVGRGALKEMGRGLLAAAAVALAATLCGPPGVALAEAPKLTLAIAGPHEGSVTNGRPLFGGATTDSVDEVALTIYEGAAVGGPLVQALATQSPLGGAWSLGPAEPLANGGTYTAQATQTNSANEVGMSLPLTFTVNTASPTVTLNQPTSPSKDTTPSFTGSASDTTPVTVHVYAGTTATGPEASTATAEGTGGSWHSNMTSALLSGQYTAVATQPSSLGNPAGVSETVDFTVDTAPPIVTLNQPPSPSNDTTPSFTGLASDTTPITVAIYEGPKAVGTAVSHANATAIEGEGGWTSSEASPALENGEYTAVATQASSLGNAQGKSSPVAFTVDTKAPTVTLNQPPSPSNNTTPSFSGRADDNTPVVVQIYMGTTVEEGAQPVATAQAQGTGGDWTSGGASPSLADGQYTAKATQTFGKDTGTSQAVTFTVDTTPPLVTLTSPAEGSSTGGGSRLIAGAAGTAPGDRPAVTIALFAGATVGGQPVQELTVQASKGTWSATFGGLSPGTYTAQARQADEAANTGVSSPLTFTLAGSAPAAAPAAAFNWFPPIPQTGEPVSIVSSSTDAASPITAIAWALTPSGLFQPGGPVLTTSFSSPGAHLVQMRVSNADGLSSTAAATISVVGSQRPLMQPFPVVRIAGAEAGSGVKLKLLTVQAPSGARITVTCKGHGCPLKSASRVAASGKVRGKAVEFRRFERRLRPGVTLEVRVWKSGEIGKYTRFYVRRRKLPERVDLCLDPAGVRPMACPS